MRIILYGLLALVVILIGAALVGPSFIDWNAHKERITAEVRDATGRDVAIDGDINLAILPAPALSADQVRLANLPGGSRPYMAELRELRVRIALLPLLQGRIKVESVSLVEPKILLEVLADGRRNWEFGAADARSDTGQGDDSAGRAEGGIAGQVQLDSFLISGGTVVYRDEANGQEEHIGRLDTEIVAESLAGPFTSRGSAVLRGIETDFDLGVGRLVKAGATPLNATFRLPDADAQAQFAGSVSIHPETVRFRGQLKGEGGDLGRVVRAFSNGSAVAVPDWLGQSFGLQGDVSGDLKQANATDIRLQLGDTAMSGGATLSLGPPLDIMVSLNAARIDIDELLLSASEPGQQERTQGEARDSAAAARESVGAEALSLPRGAKARLELAVEGLVYRGQAARQLRFDASLQDGRITVGQAMALLPGGSDLSLTGSIGDGEGGPRFDGRVEVVSDNVRGLVAWLGGDMDGIPADRLRRMSFSGRIEANREQVGLKDIDLRIDLTRVTGGIVAALRQRLGLGVGLAVDTLNLDAYLPAKSGAKAETEVSGEARNSAPPADREAPLSVAMALIDDLDANLDVRFGSLTYMGTAAKALRLDGTLQNGSLTLRQASVGEVAGARAEYAGRLTDLTTDPQADGELILEVSNARRFARLLGIDAEPPDGLDRLTLRSTVKGSAKDIALDSELTALGGSLSLDGTARLDTQPISLDLAVAVRHPDLPGLVAALGGGSGLNPALGGLELSANLAGSPLEVEVDKLTGKLGPLAISGKLMADFSKPKPFVDAELSTTELPLVALLAPAAQPARETGTATSRPNRIQTTGRRWSWEAIDLGSWHALDADLALSARGLRLDRTTLEDVVFSAKLRDGVLNIERLIATLYGGALHLVGKVAATDPVEADFTITAFQVELGELLRQQADFKRLSGPIDLNAEVATKGASEAELISALNGKGALSGTLSVKLGQDEQLGALGIGILGKKIKRIRNLADATTMLLSNFSGAPAALKGTFAVRDGVVVTDDTRIDGVKARALTRGRADLPNWRLDSQTDVFEDAAPDAPYLTANLRGPLDTPNVRIGGQPFQRRPSAPAPSKDLPPKDEAAPHEPPEKPEPRDLLKNLLEDLQG